jgi:hypothetical protein
LIEPFSIVEKHGWALASGIVPLPRPSPKVAIEKLLRRG